MLLAKPLVFKEVSPVYFCNFKFRYLNKCEPFLITIYSNISLDVIYFLLMELYTVAAGGSYGKAALSENGKDHVPYMNI